MKGQNLRLFVNDYAVAAEKNCQLSLQAQTESAGSKDTEGDFDKIDVMSKSATLTCEALYVPLEQFDLKSVDKETIAGYNFATKSGISFDNNRVYKFVSLDGNPIDVALYDNSDKKLLVHDSGLIVYFPYKDEYSNPDVFFGVKNQSDWNRVAVLQTEEDEANYLENFLSAYYAGEDVTATFSLTGGETGSKNRDKVEDGDVISLTGKITDLQLQANDRQFVTYSATIKGWLNL